MELLYLHGFASSPDSGKARYLADRLGPFGCRLHVPDLNEPDFSTLTVTRMLDDVDRTIAAIPAGPVMLIGSSLGGFVALHAAARRAAVTGAHPIAGLILLAPAVDFASSRESHLTPADIDDWRRTNRRDVFHHAYGRTVPVRFALYADGHGYDAFGVRVDVPMLVFQGIRDTIVRPESVIEFAASRPNVTLRLLDDDHQLQNHLDEVWRESAAFLGLDRTP
ncbi:MAG TPA: YqiA/YcfP family alpha/beta fold hydrolase [Vicinamibacterales bacterium]